MRRLSLSFSLVFGMLLFATAPGFAETKWIDLPVSTGGTVKALLGVPDGVTSAPGVVYSHGTAVRRWGYSGAKSRGYDVADYVEALNQAGYVALAPIRDQGVLSNPSPGEVMRESTSSVQAGINQGIASLQAAVDFLKAHPTANGKVGTVGFSEGGLVSVWTAMEGLDVQAIVLMSPATYKQARRLSLKNAVGSGGLGGIKAPVMVTLGRNDNPPILGLVKRKLIPALKEAGVAVATKLDYPGDHSWFWKVRPEHFSDVQAFLDKQLK